MYYRKLRPAVIQYCIEVYEEFSRARYSYFQEVVETIKYRVNNEYNQERRLGRYTASSLDEWRDDLMRQLRELISEYEEEFADYDTAFRQTITNMRNYKFTEKIEGYRVIFNFANGEIEYEEIPEKDQYGCRLQGYTEVVGEWKNIEDRKFRLLFADSPRPSYTELIKE